MSIISNIFEKFRIFHNKKLIKAIYEKEIEKDLTTDDIEEMFALGIISEEQYTEVKNAIEVQETLSGLSPILELIQDTSNSAMNHEHRQILFDDLEIALKVWDTIIEKNQPSILTIKVGQYLFDRCVLNEEVIYASKITVDIVHMSILLGEIIHTDYKGDVVETSTLIKLMSFDLQMYWLEKVVASLNDMTSTLKSNKITINMELAMCFATTKDINKRNEIMDEIHKDIFNQLPYKLRTNVKVHCFLSVLSNSEKYGIVKN